MRQITFDIRNGKGAYFNYRFVLKGSAMSYATLMVYVDVDNTPEQRVHLAASLADKFNATLIGLSALAIRSPFVAERVVIQEVIRDVYSSVAGQTRSSLMPTQRVSIGVHLTKLQNISTFASYEHHRRINGRGWEAHGKPQGRGHKAQQDGASPGIVRDLQAP